MLATGVPNLKIGLARSRLKGFFYLLFVFQRHIREECEKVPVSCLKECGAWINRGKVRHVHILCYNFTCLQTML